MADVIVNTGTNDPKELLGQGIRAYVLQDYSTAVTALSKASELMAAKYGDDMHDSLGDVYLYYGKALLGLSREESEPLGDAVPKNFDDDSDDGEADNTETEEGDTEMSDEKNNGEADTSESKDEAEKVEESTSNGPNADTADSTAVETSEDQEPTDLQVAWEVLELAKKIYEKQGEKGTKNLADTLIVLGEISLESENFEAAINDIKVGLEIQKSLFGKDSRTLAETYYKLGVAYSTDSQIEDAIKSFNESLQYLNNRVATLEKNADNKEVMEEEIREIKGLIPDIEEKIADMKTYKDEVCQCDIRTTIKNFVNKPNFDKSGININVLQVKRKSTIEAALEKVTL